MYLRNCSIISDARQNNTTLPSRPIFEQAKWVRSALWFLLYYKKWKITKERILGVRQRRISQQNKQLKEYLWGFLRSVAAKMDSNRRTYWYQERKKVRVTGRAEMPRRNHRQHAKKLVSFSTPKTCWWRRKHSLAWTCKQHLAQDINGLVPSSPMYEFEGRGSVFSPLEVKHISGIRGLVFCPHLEKWTKEVVSPTETGTASLSTCKVLKRKYHQMNHLFPGHSFDVQVRALCLQKKPSTTWHHTAKHGTVNPICSRTPYPCLVLLPLLLRPVSVI